MPDEKKAKVGDRIHVHYYVDGPVDWIARVYEVRESYVWARVIGQTQVIPFNEEEYTVIKDG